MTTSYEMWNRIGLEMLEVLRKDDTISTNKMMTFRITINKYQPMLYILIPESLTARLSLLYKLSFRDNNMNNWSCLIVRIGDRFCYSFERGLSFPSTIVWFDVLSLGDAQLDDNGILHDLKFLIKEYGNGNIHDVYEHYKVAQNSNIDLATILNPK